MKDRTVWGVLLIALGCVSLCYAGISYSQRKTFLHVGSLIASTNETETIPLPPIVGVVAILAGVAVLAWGRSGRSA